MLSPNCMNLKGFYIDVFLDQENGFQGNTACVVPLKKWLPDNVLLEIAKENAVPETAFFIQQRKKVDLRWFTPEIEMDLCGHATLATAHCLINELGYEQKEILFSTQSGFLKVVLAPDLYVMELPSRPAKKAILPKIIEESLSIKPKKIFKSRDYLLVYSSEQEVMSIKVDQEKLDQINLDPGGIIVTSRGENCDFVSRYFTPQSSILEDPVTGSAHCTLIPYWSGQLNKNKLLAHQVSKQGGSLKCENLGQKVKVSGKAKTTKIQKLTATFF